MLPSPRRAWLLPVCAAWWLLGCTLLSGATPGEGSTAIHRVQPGDTIPRLCWQYRVRAEWIRAANPGVEDPPRVGRKIVIPLRAPTALATEPKKVRRTMPASPKTEVRPLVTTTRLPPVPNDAEPTSGRAAATTIPETPAAPPAAASVRVGDYDRAAHALVARHLRFGSRCASPGGGEPWQVDEAGTVRWLCRSVAGVGLPGTAAAQYEALRRRGRVWAAPPEDEAAGAAAHPRPGDLLFWQDTRAVGSAPGMAHVMMLLAEDDARHWRLAGARARDGVSVYDFDPAAPEVGCTSLLGNVYRPGRLAAFGRP